MASTYCTKDYHPCDHAYDLMFDYVLAMEEIAAAPNRMSHDEIRRMCDSETPAMRLYFISKRIKRASWDLTWVNWMKKHYEGSRHKRPDNGSQGFKPMNEAYGQLISEKPIAKPERRYRIPTDEECLDKFKRLEQEMLK